VRLDGDPAQLKITILGGGTKYQTVWSDEDGSYSTVIPCEWEQVRLVADTTLYVPNQNKSATILPCEYWLSGHFDSAVDRVQDFLLFTQEMKLHLYLDDEPDTGFTGQIRVVPQGSNAPSFFGAYQTEAGVYSLRAGVPTNYSWGVTLTDGKADSGVAREFYVTYPRKWTSALTNKMPYDLYLSLYTVPVEGAFVNPDGTAESDRKGKVYFFHQENPWNWIQLAYSDGIFGFTIYVDVQSRDFTPQHIAAWTVFPVGDPFAPFGDATPTVFTVAPNQSIDLQL
jgi:hypothetical protein